VTQRENLINLLKMIDYELSSAAPASADLTFTLSRSYGETVTIPAGTECQSVADEALGIESFYFETDADLQLLTGELSGTIGATEGKSGSETLGTSDETAYQKFAVSASPIIDGTLKVFVDGEQWTEVDTLGLSEPDAKEYYIQRDADEKITVFFGDNSQGLVPGNGAVISATYRVGGGSAGNVGPGTITILNSALTHQGSPLSATVTNASSASGGTDRETADHAKTHAPLELRSLDRCVTGDDYETIAEGYAGVERAKVFALEPKNYRAIDVHIVPGGGGDPSQSLIDGLTAYLDARRMILDIMTVKAPDYISIEMELTVYVLDTYVQATVQTAVNDALTAFFVYTSTFIDFAKSIYLSDLYRELDKIEGVDHVDIDKLYRVPKVKYEDWKGGATFGSITISESTKEETWTVEMTSATTFKVTGSVSGLQTASGSFDVPYVSDNSEVAFTITSAAPPSKLRERAIFKTSKLLGNVAMDGSEFPVLGTVSLTMSGGL
ncbi:MAG: baseplate J/gp47 family protein, partial [bacterium]